MFTYFLIGLSLVLVVLAGMQMVHLFCLDRAIREKKQQVRDMERANKKLRERLTLAEEKVSEQAELIAKIMPDYSSNEDTWAEIIDEI